MGGGRGQVKLIAVFDQSQIVRLNIYAFGILVKRIRSVQNQRWGVVPLRIYQTTTRRSTAKKKDMSVRTAGIEKRDI